jgi:hypothetical protein
MSDCIVSGERKAYSAQDGDLRKRVYNHDGVRILIQRGVRKILCRSKGVLRTLESAILRSAGSRIATIDAPASTDWQNKFLAQPGGDPDAIGPRVATVFAVNNIPEPIRALAIPSPGSPQRQLRTFGFAGGDWEGYSDTYFRSASQWLLAAE